MKAKTNDDPDLKNIKKTSEGYLLTQDQVIKLANYISELETKNKKLKVKLKEAEKQLEKAHEKDAEDFIKRIGDGLTGAGIASLLILVANAAN